MPTRRALLVVLCLSTLPTSATAQSATAIVADLAFYGDDTEFSNPFRDGDTLFGNWGRVYADVTLNDTVSVRGGIFANYRYGDFARVGQVRPVLALTMTRGPSTLVFGTYDTLARRDGPGPDRTSPHGLLPVLQVETLAFTRPWEAGLAWRVDATRLTHDAWINWQALNSPSRREKFDVGVNGRYRAAGPWHVLYQTHVVHHGGQRFAAGPVTDSVAGAIGASHDGPVPGLHRLAIEGWIVGARATADRELDDTVSGRGWLVRASAEHAAWRAHVLVFRGRKVWTEEGDPNYLSRKQGGEPVTTVRDYAERGSPGRSIRRRKPTSRPRSAGTAWSGTTTTRSGCSRASGCAGAFRERTPRRDRTIPRTCTSPPPSTSAARTSSPA